MKVKVVAIGNRLMGDDGIALKVAEDIREVLEFQGINVIVGETDIYYCFNEILDADIIFILDASYYGKRPGTITVKSIEDFKIFENKQFSQHGINLIKLIEMNNLHKEIYIIGIEIHEITYSLNISNSLNKKLKDICWQVQKVVLGNYMI
ncbi:MAG: hydrogenase maturation protease [Clostridiaceae bacterium]|nr:hydrogenase maturation protease [Clostridiaceae bacterium]